ncbi:hypothetical protein IQ07DRAFT_507477 [Pyrenochaeta sp. DS3sAY3a]|nr:hypothetical protein IQ07DRAFT_507477 [Pyrenochaeta sp. DS3sAY3a]
MTTPHRRANVAADSEAKDTVAVVVTDGLAFNVYKAILRHPNLFFQFALRLPYPAILALYAIDKEFHFRLNQYSVGLIHDYTRYHAPLASNVFSWIMYPKLCLSDPMLRPMDNRVWLARDVPGFRWVGMVLWREKVVRGILTLLATEGHRVPAAAESALCKFWVLMEKPKTRLREAFLTDRKVWSDEEILAMRCVAVKLDMRFTHPIAGHGATGLGHLLLTQKSLSVLWDVLRRKKTLVYEDTIEMVVKTYLMTDLDIATFPWLLDEEQTDVPEEDLGLLCREGWNAHAKPMKPALDMVFAEGFRRGLNLNKYLLDFALYGTVDPKTGENVPLPRLFRKEDTITMPKKGWPLSKDAQKVGEMLRVTWEKKKALEAEKEKEKEKGKGKVMDVSK